MTFANGRHSDGVERRGILASTEMRRTYLSVPTGEEDLGVLRDILIGETVSEVAVQGFVIHLLLKKVVHEGGGPDLFFPFPHFLPQGKEMVFQEGHPLFLGGGSFHIQGYEMGDFLDRHIHISQELDHTEEGDVLVRENPDAAYASPHEGKHSLFVIKTKGGGRDSRDIHHIFHCI